MRYPICTREVIEAAQLLMKNLHVSKSNSCVHLPKRLFRTLKSSVSGWSSDDDPIPFLQYLCNSPDIPCVDVNYPNGYALAKAVYSKFIPLVEFLLDHLASPASQGHIALKIAIRQKDLTTLKLLLERRGKGNPVPLDNELLKIAVVVGATDIIKYLVHEKGIIPDIDTLKNLRL